MAHNWNGIRRFRQHKPKGKEDTMNTGTIMRVTIAIVLALVLAALPAAARAGDVAKDDWFRDTSTLSATASAEQPAPDWFERAVARRIDAPAPDWFERAAARATATAPSVAPVVPVGQPADDWFRDPPAVSVAQPRGGGFDWADFALGAVSSLGVALLAGIAAVALVARRHQANSA